MHRISLKSLTRFLWTCVIYWLIVRGHKCRSQKLQDAGKTEHARQAVASRSLQSDRIWSIPGSLPAPSPSGRSHTLVTRFSFVGSFLVESDKQIFLVSTCLLQLWMYPHLLHWSLSVSLSADVHKITQFALKPWLLSKAVCSGLRPAINRHPPPT